MKREECTWWVNHLFNIAKVSEWNNGHVEDAREIETAQQMAIDALQKTAWIPVGERLPEPYESVLVSLKFQDKKFVSIDWVSDAGVWQEYRRSYVTAWMPLPTVYQGE